MHACRLTAAVLALALLAACAPAGGATTDQLSALEARVTALEATGGDDPAGGFELAVAQYFLDTAGFHAMDEALHATGVVEPSYLTTVNRVNKILRATPWPADLHDQAEALQAQLSELAEALEADDAAAAAELASGIHTAQHVLSAAIDAALGLEGHGH